MYGTRMPRSAASLRDSSSDSGVLLPSWHGIGAGLEASMGLSLQGSVVKVAKKALAPIRLYRRQQ